MVKVVLKVLLALLAVSYGALFLAWNSTTQDIVTWQIHWRYSQSLPVGILAFIGLILGAIVMGIAAWSAYAGQRVAAKRAVAQVAVAKQKLQAQLGAIKELRGDVERLEAQVASLQAGDGTWGQATQEAQSTAGGEPPNEDESPTASDDEEII